MNILGLNDPLMHLHSTVLGHSGCVLGLLPIMYLAQQWLPQFQHTDQIVVYFYAFSLMLAAIILAFYVALSTLNCPALIALQAIPVHWHRAVRAYVHLPLLCLSGLMIYFSLCFL